MSNLPGNTVFKKFETEACCGPDWNFTEPCENECTVRVQGETDSFGAEYFYFCQECFDKAQAEEEAKEPEEAQCDWCKKDRLLSPVRDFDEGSNGPVYYVCSACADKQQRAIQDEYNAMREREEEEYYEREDEDWED